MPPSRRILAVKTVVATFSGMAWSLALGSWLCTFDWAWNLYHALKGVLATLGVAGQGHCWLCGMSHAFRAIWRGRFAEAAADNSHALVLFALMAAFCASVALLLNPLSMVRRLFRSRTAPPPTNGCQVNCDLAFLRDR
jgi:hypothetical protein